MPQEAERTSPQPPRPWYARAWRSFRTWRRERWRFRVLALLLIFAWPLTARICHIEIVARLVRVATDAIRLSSASPQYYYYRAYKARDAALLLHMLRRELDRDHNGVLDAAERARAKGAGLDVAQFDVPLPHADLDQIVAAAQALKLVPHSYTADMLRHRDFYAAQAKDRELEARWRRMVDAEFARFYAWPDYTKWATWQWGIVRFAARLSGLSAALGVSVALLILFLAAVAVSAQFRWHRLVGCVVVLAAILVADTIFGFTSLPIALLQWSTPSVVLFALGELCVGAAVGLWAGGLAGRIHRPRVAACLCSVVIGVAMVLSAIPVVFWALVSLGLFVGDWSWSYLLFVRSLGYWQVGIGALLILAGVVGVVLLRRSGRRALQGEPNGTLSTGGDDATGA